MHEKKLKLELKLRYYCQNSRVPIHIELSSYEVRDTKYDTPVSVIFAIFIPIQRARGTLKLSLAENSVCSGIITT